MKQRNIIIIKWGALLGAGLSLINLLGYFAEKVQYYFGPVKDLLQVVAIVYCLYMAIKEIRDKQEDGLIKFSKAFLIGGGVTFIGYFVLVLYMLLHFGAIDKEGLDRINKKNLESATAIIKKDSLTQDEKNEYFNTIKKLALKESASKQIADTGYYQHVDSCIIVIFNTFKNKIEQYSKSETAFYLLAEFDKKADKLFLEAIRQTQFDVDMNMDTLSVSIMEEVRDTMAAHPILAARIEAAKDKIPQYTKISGAAVLTTLPALLYGLMLDIFVALFLYRKEKTICSRNGNDPAGEEEAEDSEESPEDNEEIKNEE